MSLFGPRRALPPILLLGLTAVLAACGGSAASPSTEPSPSPVASATSAPTSTPAESPSAAAGEIHPIAQALVDQLNADPLVTHLEQTASVSSTDGTTTTDAIATLSADLAGADIALNLAVTSGGVTALEQEMVVVGDKAYVREPGGEWSSAPATAVASSIEQIFDAIRFVDDPSALAYVGPETVDGRTLHHLSGSGIPYAPAAGGTGQYDAFDIWVEDDGTPVTVTSTFSAADQGGNAITGQTDIEFSNWGGAIEIEAPQAP